MWPHVGRRAATIHRGAFWTLVIAKLVAGWGLGWDIRWHVTIGRDSFWIAPHLMIYGSVAVMVALAFGVLMMDTLGQRASVVAVAAGRRADGLVTILGLCGSRGFHLAAWGTLLTVLAAPIDDVWHRLFGIDVTLWSPPHLLGLFGSVVGSLGCLLIASVEYPRGSRTRLAAVVVSGALLYGGLRVTLEPAYLLAYTYGGVRFHAYAILGALILPLALVVTTRVSGARWAPLGVMVVGLVIGLAGELVAQEGFAMLKPVSVIGEAIAADPTSAIATANAIGRAGGGPPPAWVRLVALIPALAMTAGDPRVRPVGATLAYGATLFIVSGWSLAGSRAFRPMVPRLPETGIALILTIAAALLGAVLARWLARAVEDHGGRRQSRYSGARDAELRPGPATPV